MYMKDLPRHFKKIIFSSLNIYANNFKTNNKIGKNSTQFSSRLCISDKESISVLNISFGICIASETVGIIRTFTQYVYQNTIGIKTLKFKLKLLKYNDKQVYLCRRVFLLQILKQITYYNIFGQLPINLKNSSMFQPIGKNQPRATGVGVSDVCAVQQPVLVLYE